MKRCKKCNAVLAENGQFCAFCGTKTVSENIVYRIDGGRGCTLTVYEDRAVLSATGSSAPDSNTVFYSDCAEISFKRSGIVIGYLHFVTKEKAIRRGEQRLLDEDCFLFCPAFVKNEYMEEVRDYILSRMGK